MSFKTTRKKDNISEPIKIDYNTIKAILDNKYKKKKIPIDIDGSCEYYDNFYLIPALCDNRLNRYEGFLLVESNEKNVIEYFSSKYSMGTTGYIIRLIFLFYTDNKGEKKLFIKDYYYRRKMTKNIDKLSILFKRKIKEFLDMKDESSISSIQQQINKLFDRSDLIEEFYKLYQKCKRYISKQIKGVTEEKDEFIDNFMMQMMILWYLQEKGFLNDDRRYFITKFNELRGAKSTITSYISTNSNKFKSYYEFLLYLFDKLQGSNESDDNKYYKDDIVGKVVIVGPAVFLNGTEMPKGINIPDECFYNNEATPKLITKDVEELYDEDVPLLNLFESREWTEYEVDEYVIGSLYEKLITGKEKKEKGAYYTPEAITSYICKNTIEPYLLDEVNKKQNSSYPSLENIIENADETMLRFIFKKIKNIKIVDPAVGSAHFLESAIDVLLDIYLKVIKKARSLNLNNFDIVIANNRGELEKIDLTTINDENKFALYVKFFILLARNVYGVDIMPTAINIAKARLFLTLARHFNAKEDTYVRFPNIHFNLMVGNSLIGYVNLPDTTNNKYEEPPLFSFVNNELQHVKEEISSIIKEKEFNDFLMKIRDKLYINIIEDIKELDNYLSKQYLTWSDLKEVLKIKSKLVDIFVVTLSTKYARTLNKLLHCIDEKLNEKLDKKFVDTYRITLDDLKKIKRFHWLLHFPEVFLEKGGFDIVIGNPPYIRQEEINKIVNNVFNYKGFLQQIYSPISDDSFDLAIFFILRSLQIMNDKGYHSFIITNKWIQAKYGRKIRDYLRKHIRLINILDLRIKVFKNANVDTLIYILQKDQPQENNEIVYGKVIQLVDIENVEKISYRIKQKNLDTTWTFMPECIEEIKHYIKENTKPLKELNVKIYGGIKTGFNKAFVIDTETKDKLIKKDKNSACLIKPCLTGKDIKRYSIEYSHTYLLNIPQGLTKKLAGINNLDENTASMIFKKYYPAIYDYLLSIAETNNEIRNRYDKGDFWWELRPCDYYNELEGEKIIWQEISSEASYYWDDQGFYIINTAYFMTLPKSYLLILNSRLIESLFHYISQSLGNAYRRTKQYVEKIPIVQLNNDEPYRILVDYLLFLNNRHVKDKIEYNIIKYFDQLGDCLVYELYFKKKFYEDKLYEKPQEYLRDRSSKYLKPINYDRFSQLYWKGQLGDLSKDECCELKLIEEDNIKVITTTYNNMKDDSEIHTLIHKIMSHTWVQYCQKQ
ncbi:MAG: TaqI-like C-terminal specificity domain-containing protein [Candidatus Nitrosocaldus sp.]